jgi:hypothetical protein
MEITTIPLYCGTFATLERRRPGGPLYLNTGDKDLNCMLAQDWDNLIFHSPCEGINWDEVTLTYPDITWREIQSKMGIFTKGHGCNNVPVLGRNQLLDPFTKMMKFHIQDRSVFAPINVFSRNRTHQHSKTLLIDPNEELYDVGISYLDTFKSDDPYRTTPVGCRLYSDMDSTGDNFVNIKVYDTYEATTTVISATYCMHHSMLNLRLVCEPVVAGIMTVHTAYVPYALMKNHRFGPGDLVRIMVQPYDLFTGSVKELVEYRSKEQAALPTNCPSCKAPLTSGLRCPNKHNE